MPTMRFSISVSLHFIAGADVQAGNCEEQHDYSDKNEISHNSSMVKYSRQYAGRIIKRRSNSAKTL